MKKLLVSYYLCLFEPFAKICILVSVGNQIMNFLSVLDNKTGQELTAYNKIDLLFTIELVLAYLMTLDCFLRLWLHEFFLYNTNYGTFYLLIDCLAGPIALGHDIYFLIFIGQYSIMGFLMRFSKLFTFCEIRGILHKLQRMTKTIFPLFFTLFSIFYIFSYLAKSMYNRDAPQYFGTLSGSMFTMFQILTLDSWGVIGRSILHLNGMISALYLAIFVFIMTYFFLNILIGFIVDNMAQGDEENTQLKLTHPHVDPQSAPESNRASHWIIGKYYDIVVFCCFLLSLFEVYTFVNSSGLEGRVKYLTRLMAIGLEFLSGIIYFIHFIALVYFKIYSHEDKTLKNHSNMEGIFLGIHTLSGPVAFVADIYQYYNFSYIKYGNFLSVLSQRILPEIRTFPQDFQDIDDRKQPEVHPHLFQDHPEGEVKLLSTFTTLMGLIILLAFWATEKLRFIMPDFFGNLNISVYSFIQILTMDDWCAGITRKLIRNAQESALPFIIFIFFANYILLNIMLAISCDQMKEVSQQQRIFEGECDSLSSFSVKSLDLKDFTVKHSILTVLTNVMKLLEFRHNFFYSKLIRDHTLKALHSPRVLSDQESEVELYFLLSELKSLQKSTAVPSSERTEDFRLEYRGKVVVMKSGRLFLRVAENAELSIFARNFSSAEKQRRAVQEEMRRFIRKRAGGSCEGNNNQSFEETLEGESATLLRS